MMLSKRFLDLTNFLEIICYQLLDLYGVMRGVKNGIETKLRDQVAPNLLDVDGDACHHVQMLPSR